MAHYQTDGTLTCSVYWKPTRTGLYLNHHSHQHLAQKRGGLLTLIERVPWVANPEHLAGKLVNLHHIFQQNGYTKFEIKQALKSHRIKVKSQQEEDQIINGIGVTPFWSMVTNNCLISSHQTKTTDEVCKRPPRHECPNPRHLWDMLYWPKWVNDKYQN